MPIVRYGLSPPHFLRSRSLAAQSNFDDWVGKNPLPTRKIATDTENKSHLNSNDYITQRFPWHETPGLLTRLQGGAEQLQWSRGSRSGHYIAHVPSISDPLYILTLPKVLLHFVDIGGDATIAVSELQALQQAGHGISLGKQLMVLLSADSVALALWSDNELIRHKIYTGYTIRKKQGKSQLTHLRQGGGGHSVGGSIRAREVRRLFQSGAEKLFEWKHDIKEASLLFQGGGIRNWNELYAAKNPSASSTIDRDDIRWHSVGIGVCRPRLRDLEGVRKELCRGTLLMLRDLEGN